MSNVLQLIADVDHLVKGLNRAQRSVDQFVDASGRAGQSLGGGVNRALDSFTDLAKGGAAAAGVLAGGLIAAGVAAVSLTLSAGKQLEALDHLQQKTGLAVQTSQAWSVIMAENNFDAQTLATGMRTLAKHVIDARDSSSTAAAEFAEMGIAVSALGSTEETIKAIADRFATMPDGADKARLAVTLFGRAGLELIPVLNRGAAALEASRLEALRFGLVLRDDQVRSLTAADDAVDRLGVALDGLKTRLALTFAGPVTSGIDAITNGIASLTNVTSNYAQALEQIKQEHPFIAGLFPAGAAALATVRASKIPPSAPGSPPGGPQDAHVAAFTEQAATREVEKGLALRREHITAYQQQLALGRAEETLGRTLNAIEQRKQASIGQQLDDLFAREASMQVVTEQEERGWAIVRESLDAWRNRNKEIELAADRARVVDEAQQALFQTESGLFDAAETARRVRMDLIQAEGDVRRQEIEETIFDEERKFQAIMNLETQLDTRRREAIQSFPTFFEKQMNAIVQSNSFSVAQITTTWTQGLAGAIVRGGDFVQQAWEATQVAIVQAVLNAGVQMAAQWALNASVELGILTATEAAKAGLKTASNATLLAGDAATAAGHVSIWAAANAAVIASFGAAAGAVKAFFVTTVIPFFIAIGKALMAFLTAVASAAKATIFGIPYGVAVLAGVAVIGAAIGIIAATQFADGGIATGPTLGMVGEAGSSEAVIPLNKRGAGFMREVIGGGGGAELTIKVPVIVDGRTLATVTAKHTGYAWRKLGAPA